MTTPTKPTGESLEALQTIAVDRVAQVFHDLMQEWRLPAAVVAEELYNCLISVSCGADVDPDLLESSEFATAIRHEQKSDREFTAFLTFFTEQVAQPGSELRRRVHPLGEAFHKSLCRE